MNKIAKTLSSVLLGQLPAVLGTAMASPTKQERKRKRTVRSRPGKKRVRTINRFRGPMMSRRPKLNPPMEPKRVGPVRREGRKWVAEVDGKVVARATSAADAWRQLSEVPIP